MKKLKLNIEKLEGAEMLTRDQLKNVMGGMVPYTFIQPDCGTVCTSDQNCKGAQGGCTTCWTSTLGSFCSNAA